MICQIYQQIIKRKANAVFIKCRPSGRLLKNFDQWPKTRNLCMDKAVTTVAKYYFIYLITFYTNDTVWLYNVYIIRSGI